MCSIKTRDFKGAIILSRAAYFEAGEEYDESLVNNLTPHVFIEHLLKDTKLHPTEQRLSVSEVNMLRLWERGASQYAMLRH